MEAEIATASVTDLLCTGLLASVTVKVSEVAEAVAVGVPVIAPVAAFNESPPGNVPLVRAQL